MKTPIQELIEKLEDAKKTVSSLSELKGINKAVFIAEKQIEKEKEVFEKIWFDSTAQFGNEAEMTYKKLFSDYYHQTFTD